MTLSGTIRYIERIALMQPSVKMVVPNDIFRLNATPEAEYAVFGWTQGQHSIGADDSYVTYSFTFFYVDRLTEDKGNQLEIQSVGITVLDNIIRTIIQAGVQVAGSYTFTSFNQRFVDECAGVFCAISLRVPLDSLCEDTYFDFNDDFNDDFNAGGLERDADRGGVLGPDRHYAAPDADDFYTGGGGSPASGGGPGGGGQIIVNIPVKDVTLDGVSVVVDKVAVLPAYPKTLAELLPDEDHNVVTDGQIGAWNAKSDFSGSYNDLTDKPTIPDPQVNADWNENDPSSKAFIENKPSIPAAQVNADWDAVSGVAQILNKPTIPVVTGKADKVENATPGNFAGLDADGNLTDSGSKAVDFATAAQGAKADTAVQPEPGKGLFSGNYNDLSNKPTIPAAPVNADWNANSGLAQILNKPTIPAAQVNADWNANSGVAEILNKPTIPSTYAGSPTAGGFANKAVAIPFGDVDSDSTATNIKATVDNFPAELAPGVCAYIRNDVIASASGWTLNINGTGALPVYQTLADATRTSTIFSAASTHLFIYNPTRVEGGCWDLFYGYNSNENTIGYNLRTNGASTPPAAQKYYRYRLLFTSANNQSLVPANTSTSTSTTAAKTVNQTAIDPFGVIFYYGATSAVNAGASASSSYLWMQYNGITLGYSFNRTGGALEMTARDPVYLKCAPQSDGSAIMDADTPIVQAIPSTADGKIYILLGYAESATAITLYYWHPVYYIDANGRKRIWTGEEIII